MGGPAVAGEADSQLSDEEIEALHRAWSINLNLGPTGSVPTSGRAWPKKVTAFRADMAVHGKYGEPCPRCGTPVQRIVYADNETNYCPTCQTGGKLLADRSLSRCSGRIGRALSRSWRRAERCCWPMHEA